MSAAALIGRNEWRMMRRSRVAQIAVLILLALSVVAALTSIAHRDASDDLRARFQAQADAEFDGQPARHPHRMVHYGHFVFRSLPPLAAFDPGVDPFTGTTIFLEGHRQNSANFGDVRQSSLLARFGHLTPAFVLQALAPLVLIFIGFGVVAREREQGTLRVLAAHGVGARALMAGKARALGLVAALMLVPAGAALAWLVAAESAPILPAALILGSYAAYLAVWVIAIVAVSSLCAQARAALVALLALWTATTILLPRIAPDLALSMAPLPTRLETDIAIQRDLRQIGDSHNPDDPHFAEFKARVLREYGVEREEDMPVNFRGLLSAEGEKLTSQLFDSYAERQFAEQRVQSAIATGFGLLSPATISSSGSTSCTPKRLPTPTTAAAIPIPRPPGECASIRGIGTTCRTSATAPPVRARSCAPPCRGPGSCFSGLRRCCCFSALPPGTCRGRYDVAVGS
jgi:ABC-2 type transport system permease protein